MRPPDTPPLRVALFTNNYLPRVSGVAVAVAFLERSLRAAGHETLVVAPDYVAEDPAEPRRVHRVRSMILLRGRASIPLPYLGSPFRAIAAFAPDVLHAHHPFLLGPSAARIADALGIPLVYTFHTFYEQFLHYVRLDRGWVARILRAHVLRFVRRCDLVVAPTEPIREHLVERFGLRMPTRSAPTGLDPARFVAIDPAARAAHRATLGGDGPSTPLLVWAGRLAREKRPELAIETLAALRSRGCPARLAFLGRGPLTGALERAAREAGLLDHVRFVGHVDQEELPSLLAAADLFLFTSEADTQGIVLYEAWASGTPILAARSMASRAVVRSGQNGEMSEGRPEALASAALELLRRPRESTSPFPWDEFSPSALAGRWAEIYDTARAAGRRVAGVASRRVPRTAALARDSQPD